ncbi:MAG TPA: potassium-transporting ATPase subunit C [Acidimicrobiales bacterium]|jgi:K+-transporting ATPase ATPase C chain|nr:potassium-transporting ATPase subunit C [Acidimicrobiales bacterium]
MLTQLRRSAIFVIIWLLIAGLAYPLVGVGLSQLFFEHQADGSITANGSTLIGQNWSQTNCPGHLPGSCVFQGRPDALGPYSDGNSKTPNPAGHPGDDPLVANGVAGESGATELGPRSQELLDYTKDLISYWHRRGVQPTSDLVTTSGSGIDPDITPQDARVQIPMVSRATGLSATTLQHLVSQQSNGMQLGFLGSPYINVLQLNEALAKLET